jgi:hypothetical protein
MTIVLKASSRRRMPMETKKHSTIMKKEQARKKKMKMTKQKMKMIAAVR